MKEAAQAAFEVIQVGAEGGLEWGCPIFSPQVRLLHRKGSEEVVRPLLWRWEPSFLLGQ